MGEIHIILNYFVAGFPQLVVMENADLNLTDVLSVKLCTMPYWSCLIYQY